VHIQGGGGNSEHGGDESINLLWIKFCCIGQHQLAKLSVEF